MPVERFDALDVCRDKVLDARHRVQEALQALEAAAGSLVGRQIVNRRLDRGPLEADEAHDVATVTSVKPAILTAFPMLLALEVRREGQEGPRIVYVDVEHDGVFTVEEP